ncbi:hypothetical protein H5410_002753 [Solanum commersonii]|uniref:Uncharacterized protein n=1 Tax=Solanum commersonii TaxID=4109 RepID=A0A9J6B323_SOLCO|nr:hypothetical protein H5410_002753 [Solanum commersonii]
MCCEGSLGVVSRCRRCTRRSALWSTSSPFSISLRHLRYCLAELFDDIPTSTFHRRLDLFPSGLSTLELWVRLRPFGDSPNALGDPQAFFSVKTHKMIG